MKYKLKDLIDIEEFQELQDRLNKVCPFPSSIIDNDGNILTATAWQDICVHFHRANKQAERVCIESDQYIKDHLAEADPAVSYHCPHGLVDNAIPIIIDGVHYGNFFTGQFFLKKPDLEFFRAQAEKYGFDQEAYLEAVKRVPIWSPEQLDNYLSFISGLIEVISESGLQRIKEKESRQRVQKSARLYSSILKAAMDGYWRTSTDGRLLEVNDSYCSMSGYREDELLAMRISDLEALESPRETDKHMRKLILSGSERFETKHRRKDGSLFDVEVSIQHRADEEAQCICFLRDITQQKQAEEALRRANRELKALWGVSTLEEASLKEISDHILSSLISMTDSAYGFYGFMDDEEKTMAIHSWSGQAMADCSVVDQPLHFPIQDAGVWGEAVRRRDTLIINDFSAGHQGMKGMPEGHVHLKNLLVVPFFSQGRIVSLAAVANRERDYDAEDVAQINSFLSSVQAVIERRQAKQDLAESEERFDLAMEFSNDGLFDWNLVTNEIYYSPSWKRLLGYEDHEIPNEFSEWERLTREDDVAQSWAMLNEVLEGKRERFEKEFRMRHKDGHWVDILSRANVVRDKQGRAVRVVGTHVDITKRKRAEEELSQAKTFLESITDIAYTADTQGNITWVNKAIEDVLGLTPQELSGKPFLPLFIDEDHESLTNVYLRTLGGESLENTLTFTNGRTCHFTSLPLKEAKGQIVGTFGVARDITDAKRLEREIRTSEERNRRILATALDGFWRGDIHGRLMEVNEAYCRMSGYGKQELLSMRIPDLEAVEKEAETAAHMERIMREGKDLFETKHRRKDGTLFDAEVAVNFITSDHGGQFIAFVRDITKRKHAETALKESESLYRMTFDAIPDSITITHVADGRYRYVNDGFCKLTGYTREEVLGKTPSDIDLYAQPEDRTEMMQALRHDGKLLNYEVKFRSKDGTVWDSLFSALPLQIEGEDSLIALAKDISAEKSAEREKARLERLLAQAQKMDALGTLSSGIAHDFNNILAAILGYSELAQDELPKDNPSIRQDLAEITKAAMKAKKLVRQILTFSRVTEGQRRPLSLVRVAQEARAILERTLPKMVDLRLDLQEELWPVNADPQQMEQVFINLASNAADAIEDRGTVVIGAQNLEPDKNCCQSCGEELAGRQVLIKVEDDGKGMRPEVLAKIFEPFYTTKGVGKGTGLGLSTVYGIVTGHDGHICCQSKEGEGSTFFIYLPASSQGEPVSEPEESDLSEGLSGSGKILVVDDEPTVRDIARKMLSRNGYEVIQAASGEEALAIYQERPQDIDLVLMDLGMPGMGGKTCLKEIRRLDPDARVLIASGYIQYELTDELEFLGAAGMVSKPYRKADILKAVKEALGS